MALPLPGRPKHPDMKMHPDRIKIARYFILLQAVRGGYSIADNGTVDGPMANKKAAGAAY